MIKYFLIFTILLWDGAFALKYTEKRNVTSSTGKTFECFYTITYTATALNKKKSTVVCNPNTNGGVAIERFYIPDFGYVQVDSKIVKGKDKVTTLTKVEEPPASESAGGLLGCSCRMPNPMMMMNMSMPAAGRSLRKLENHLSKVTMRRDPESNKSELTPVAPLQPTNRLFIIKLLLLAALIPTITTAITNALAAIGIGRSLSINARSEVEERKEDLEIALNQLQSAERKFKNALGEHAEDRTFLVSLIQNAIRNTIIARIQAFLASLIPAGRSLKVENKQLLWNLINQQQQQSQSSTTSSTTTVNPLEALLGGTGGGSPLGGGPLGSLLGGSLLGGSTGGGSPLESLLGESLLGGSTGGGSPLESLLSESLLGGSNGGGSPLESLLSGSGSGGLLEQIIQQQMEAQMEAILAEIIGSNGGMEEIMGLMGINGGLEEIMSLAGMTGGMEEMMNGLAGEIEGMMTEMEGGMEQFMNQMMTEMGMNGSMEEMMNELMAEMGGEMPEYIDLPPLQCDCVPKEENMTTSG